ncbi:MATE family efflux transporter [Pseudoflavonifractor sp. An184]|uniref:MATE family efflux transporter n=1 Tax=Pseudoflavonifractor sp. An184 TaxID=1965576 RepID=UPI000B3A8A87|nr:MATE family efflux transporter [Pseudoflavonifractor sp. An184]OUP54771.1 MATE family efflux transporter [Pseudoflavonifractor sp. An184]
MRETFMKERPILPLLASMALPMVLSMLVNSLYNIVDSFFVAQISEAAMTALSLVYPVQNFINAVAIGFGVGINAVISIALGAGDRRRADAAATHGMALSALHGLILTLASIAVMPLFLARFTTDPAVIQMGLAYSKTAFSFSVIIMLGLSFEKIFQAVGRMKVTMAALLTGCVSNILLDPVLIFGLGPFPELGISGAALATGIGQALTLLVYLAAYRLIPIPVRLRRDCLRPDATLDRKLYGVGVPAILNLALPSLLISVLNGLLSVYSQSYVVILGIYYKLQTFLYLPASGIVQGMRPLIGYNYGAGERGRVRQLYNATLCASGIIMAFGTVVCLLWAEPLMGLFTSQPDTIQAGGTALRIICAGFVISSVSVTSSGALEGLGKGAQSLVISLCRYVVVILPAAFLLCRTIGPDGVWHAFWITEAVTAAAAFWVYRRTVNSSSIN